MTDSNNVKRKKETPERISVTQRPNTKKLLDDIIAATQMSRTNIYNVAIDVLHFVWTVLNKGGTIGVKFPERKEYHPVNIFIPGITNNPTLQRK